MSYGQFPTGTILDFAGTTAPSGWVLCDGTIYNSITDEKYKLLYSVIGNIYGGSDGSDFQVPDARDRVVTMKGTAKSTLGVKSGAVENTPSGSNSDGAVQDTTLSTAQLASHSHEMFTVANAGSGGTGYRFDWNSDSSGGIGYPQGVQGGGAGSNTAHNHSFTQPTFSGDAMNIEQPYIVFNKIIKL